MSRVFLALGSNKGDRKKFIRNALKTLSSDKKINLKKTSKFYETIPYGKIPQNNYLNGVVLIETDYSPNEIYFLIKKIEKEVGRTKSVRWGEREIDIDIILIDSLVLQNEYITIPHKDFAKRDFVLLPLFEIDNELIDPKSKNKIKNLIKLLDERFIINEVDINLN
jgi:2-amino-4-hydroxy-6-hydroxymethyldihydropteridine diphosphokinase